MKRLLLGIGLLVAATMVRADTPPEWLIGTFHGFNGHYAADMDLTVSPSGEARVEVTYSTGRRGTNAGYYVRNRLVLDGKTFRVEQSGNGIRTTQEDDTLNWVKYDRVGGGGRGNGGLSWALNATGRRPDSWMIGTFQGYNGHYDTEQNLTISSSGRITIDIRYRQTGRKQTQTGRILNDRFTLNDKEFRIEKVGSGVRTTQLDDRLNWVKYDRISSDDPDYGQESNNVGNIPNWLRGRFTAYNRVYAADMVFNGDAYSVTIQVNSRDGSRKVQTGQMRNGRLFVEGIEFTVERSGRGFRMTQVDDRRNTVVYERER